MKMNRIYRKTTQDHETCLSAFSTQKNTKETPENFEYSVCTVDLKESAVQHCAKVVCHKDVNRSKNNNLVS